MQVTAIDDQPISSSGAASSSDGSESLPRRFERFTLLRHIARGGMGEVYLATSSGIEGAERPCVIKIIRREHAEDRSFLARFLDEARIQAQLHHPGVAQILEAATDGTGKPYVVVEHVEGRNLSELRQRAAQLSARISWPDAVAVALSIADALAHVHERTDARGNPLDIVHRDLSPQNVMVGYAGDVKLIDFGTARGQNRRCQTIAGIVFAKPGYVAPEVANNTPGSAPADIYALGVMLWELVAGRRFLSGDPAEHLAAVASGQRPLPPIAQQVDAPRELDAILSRLTATRVQDRYTAREATMDLVMLLKRAPSLSDGERSVRARVASLMGRLYPAEPARSRAEFARLLASARHLTGGSEAAPSANAPRAEASEQSSDPSVLRGTRYRLVREIGRGSMGVVYEAYHLDLGRTVALKLLPKEQTGSVEHLARFRAEARAIAKIGHENLVKLFDFGVSQEGQAYFAMELLEGETLEARLSRERGMDYREGLRIGVQVCRALEAAHQAGLVHRDIKPANLFLTREGGVKLLDFGLAQTVNAGSSDPASSPGVVAMAGTPEYMAPEQTLANADVRCDLYALGAVLYELSTGALPHEGENTVALLDAKLKNSVVPPSKRAPQRGLPAALDQVLLRALATNPEDRFASATELRRALEDVLQRPARSLARRRKLLATAVALVGLLAVGAAARGTLPGVAHMKALSGMAPAEPPGRLPVVTEVAQARIEDGIEALHASAANDVEPADTETAAADEDSVEAEPLAVEGNDPPKALAQAADGEQREESAEEESDEVAELADDAASDEDTKVASADAKAPVSELEQRILAAQELMAAGKELKGFATLRFLGRLHHREPRAVRAWSLAAAQMKAWGEAARTARRWAAIDKGLEAQVHLARMERAVGRRDEAVALLKRIVRKHPDATEARDMLAALGWDPERVARR